MERGLVEPRPAQILSALFFKVKASSTGHLNGKDCLHSRNRSSLNKEWNHEENCQVPAMWLIIIHYYHDRDSLMDNLVESREKMVVRLGREKAPSGSIFLQLEREMVAWMMMGGSPSLLEMLLQGRAREVGKTGFGASGSWKRPKKLGHLKNHRFV